DLDTFGAGREVTHEGGAVETVGLGDPHGVKACFFQFHDLVDRRLGLTLVLERHGDAHEFVSPPEGRARPGRCRSLGQHCTTEYGSVQCRDSPTGRAEPPLGSFRAAVLATSTGQEEKVCFSSGKLPSTTSEA